MPRPETARLEVRAAGPKGRGVFARTAFAAGELIEAAPVVVLPPADQAAVARTALADFPYDWRDGTEALILGYGSFYNHSFEPNARYVRDFAELTLNYYALRAIAPGEEITVNYNGKPDDRTPLWFEDVTNQA